MLTIVAMTMGERIRQARRAFGWSQLKLASELKVKRPSVTQWETNVTEPSVENLVKLSTTLGVSVSWIVSGEGEGPVPYLAVPTPDGFRPEPQFFDSQRMPVYAQAQGGTGAEILTTDAIEYIPRPYTLSEVENAYGILITGESMVPAFRPGDVAWVNPKLPPARDVEAIFYSSRDDGGDPEAMIKHLLRVGDKDWMVEQYNPHKEFSLPRSRWRVCHRVVGKFSRR